MPTVKFKFVVSFTSQCERFPATNILQGIEGRKWLSASTDRTGKLEAIFQLEKSTKITHIDMGTHWTNSARIQVGRSSWPLSQDYETLVHQMMLMTPLDCRMSQKTIGMKMLKYDDFSAGVRDQEWDRVKVVLNQPFRKDQQFGLSLLRIITTEEARESAGTPDRSAGRSTTTSTSPHTPSTSDIQNHFFGRGTRRVDPTQVVRERLLKINSSGANGSEQEASLSRNARMVMVAAENTPRYKLPEGATPPPPTERRRAKISIETMADEFLRTLDVAALDLDKVTYADLRHRLEKRMLRKLTKEEKKIFVEKTKAFIEDQENTSRSKSKPSPRSPTTATALRPQSLFKDKAPKPTSSISQVSKPVTKNSYHPAKVTNSIAQPQQSTRVGASSAQAPHAVTSSALASSRVVTSTAQSQRVATSNGQSSQIAVSNGQSSRVMSSSSTAQSQLVATSTVQSHQSEATTQGVRPSAFAPRIISRTVFSPTKPATISTQSAQSAKAQSQPTNCSVNTSIPTKAQTRMNGTPHNGVAPKSSEECGFSRSKSPSSVRYGGQTHAPAVAAQRLTTTTAGPTTTVTAISSPQESPRRGGRKRRAPSKYEEFIVTSPSPATPTHQPVEGKSPGQRGGRQASATVTTATAKPTARERSPAPPTPTRRSIGQSPARRGARQASATVTTATLPTATPTTTPIRTASINTTARSSSPPSRNSSTSQLIDLTADWSPVKAFTPPTTRGRRKRKGKALVSELRNFMASYSQGESQSESFDSSLDEQPKAKRARKGGEGKGRGRGRGRGRGKVAEAAGSPPVTDDTWLSCGAPPPSTPTTSTSTPTTSTSTPPPPAVGVNHSSDSSPAVVKNLTHVGRVAMPPTSTSTPIASTACCPICARQVASATLDVHMAVCGVISDDEDLMLPYDVTRTPSDVTRTRDDVTPTAYDVTWAADDALPRDVTTPPAACPICGQMFPANFIEQHVNVCLDLMG